RDDDNRRAVAGQVSRGQGAEHTVGERRLRVGRRTKGDRSRPAGKNGAREGVPGENHAIDVGREHDCAALESRNDRCGLDWGRPLTAEELPGDRYLLSGLVELVGIEVAVAAGRQDLLLAVAVEVGHYGRGIGGNGVIPNAVGLDQWEIGNKGWRWVATVFEN